MRRRIGWDRKVYSGIAKGYKPEQRVIWISTEIGAGQTRGGHGIMGGGDER